MNVKKIAGALAFVGVAIPAAFAANNAVYSADGSPIYLDAPTAASTMTQAQVRQAAAQVLRPSVPANAISAEGPKVAPGVLEGELHQHTHSFVADGPNRAAGVMGNAQ